MSENAKQVSKDKSIKKNGGARSGAGRPKGSTNGIKINDLKQAITVECGVPFEVMIARTANQLYTDFWNNVERDNWIRFSNQIARYVIQLPTQEINVNTTKELEDGELDKEIKTYLKTSNWVSQKSK
jgi:hypothetical protein